MRLAKIFLRDEKGSVTVELAFFCTIMMMVLVPLSDVAFNIHNNIQLTSALRAGMYYAYRNPDDTSGIENAIEQAGDFDAEDLEVEQEDFCQCGGQVQSCDAVCESSYSKYKSIQVEFVQPLSVDYPGYGNQYTVMREIKFRTQ